MVKRDISLVWIRFTTIAFVAPDLGLRTRYHFVIGTAKKVGGGKFYSKKTNRAVDYRVPTRPGDLRVPAVVRPGEDPVHPCQVCFSTPLVHRALGK